jgi:phage shock protein PspC (stress-responsive transcriptional regulator)
MAPATLRRDDRIIEQIEQIEAPSTRSAARKDPPMSRHDRTFYRDTNDQKIGGVCSGLARYFDLDPLLVRVGFVATLLFGGIGFVIYVLLWLLVDPAPEGFYDESADGDGSLPPPAVPGEGNGEQAA